MRRAEPGSHLAKQYDLQDRAAVVTGASGLLGGAICRELAALGVSVIAGYGQRRAACEALAAELEAAGARCVPVQADLCDGGTGAAALRDACLSELGRLDLVVAAAGAKHRGPAMLTRPSALRKLVDVNLEGVIELVRVCQRPMIGARFGRIVLLGSRAGRAGLPGQTAYAATKGALAAFAASLAGELGPKGVTVNVVSAGAVRAPADAMYSADDEKWVLERIGARRLAEPEEIASLVAFLCSSSAAYVNGADIPIDGAARF